MPATLDRNERIQRRLKLAIGVAVSVLVLLFLAMAGFVWWSGIRIRTMSSLDSKPMR